MTSIIPLLKGESIKVYGPMSITVRKGVVDVLGKIFEENSRIIVHKTKNFIIHAIEDSELDMTTTPESSVLPVDENDPYLRKYRLCQEIAGKLSGVVMLVGGTDSGKSSFATLLSNHLIKAGKEPAVLDADVGQSNIGPPAFISIGKVREPVLWIGEVKPEAMRFIGDVKPHVNTWKIIYGSKELVNRYQPGGGRVVIVDTDGWVKDEKGLRYKLAFASTLKPDILIVFGGDIAPYFRRLEKLGISIFEFEVSPTRRVRSRDERRMLRSMSYREYLYNAPIVKLSLEDLVVIGLPLLEGVPVAVDKIEEYFEGKILYASILSDKLYVAGFIRKINHEVLQQELGVNKVEVFEPGSERNIYSSVSNGDADYPAIIDKIDFKDMKIILKTRFDDKISEIRVSSIRLREDFAEEFLEGFY
ncbi:MAG: Clp1/GlmU family protein [Thermosphaera sp.]